MYESYEAGRRMALHAGGSVGVLLFSIFLQTHASVGLRHIVLDHVAPLTAGTAAGGLCNRQNPVNGAAFDGVRRRATAKAATAACSAELAP